MILVTDVSVCCFNNCDAMVNRFSRFCAGSPYVAGVVIVVVPSSASCGSTEIGAGDMKPMSVKPVNITTESIGACPLTESVNTSLSQSSHSPVPPAGYTMKADDAKILQQTAVESDFAGADEGKSASVISKDVSVNSSDVHETTVQPPDKSTEQVAAMHAVPQQQAAAKVHDKTDAPVQPSRKSAYETDVAIYKPEMKSSNAGESDSVSNSGTFTSCVSVSPAGKDTVFLTPPAHVSEIKTTDDGVSSSEQQRNKNSLEDTVKVPSECSKVMVYRRSDSSVASEKRYADSEYSQTKLNVQETADEDRIDDHVENMRTEEPIETGDNKERDFGVDSDVDDDIDDDVSHSEGRTDEELDKCAADEKIAPESQGDGNWMTMSTAEKKKKNKQQIQQSQFTTVAKSVPLSTVTSETDSLKSFQLTRPPCFLGQSEPANTNESKCAQSATNTGTRETNSAAESTEQSAIRHLVRETVNTNMNPLSLTPAAETVPPTYANAVASGTNDAVNKQKNKETDKYNESKHLKADALGSGPDTDSTNVSHHTRSHSMLKTEKRTDGDNVHCYGENNKSEEQLQYDVESENKPAESDIGMENRKSNTKTTDTSDTASCQGNSNAKVCTWSII